MKLKRLCRHGIQRTLDSNEALTLLFRNARELPQLPFRDGTQQQSSAMEISAC